MTVYTLLVCSHVGTRHRVEVVATHKAAIARAREIAAIVAGEWAGKVVAQRREGYTWVARPEAMDGVRVERQVVKP